MGYTTDFKGALHFDRELTHREWLDLRELASYEKDVYERYTDTPETIPDSYLQWTPDETGTLYEWNGGEKFYDYIHWLRWVIKHYMKPHNLELNGSIRWQGEDMGDGGVITVIDNRVTFQKVVPEGVVQCPNCGEKFRPDEE